MSEEHKKMSQYVDTTGELPNVQLKFSDWYLRHKITLQKIGVGILGGFAAAISVLNLFVWGHYLFVGYWRDRDMSIAQVNLFQNYKQMQSAYKAINLSILNVRAFPNGTNMYDFSAEVANPNKRWLAKVDYHFSYIGGQTEVFNTYILPGEKKPVVGFGHETETFPSEINFVIDKVTWQEISAHKVPDVASFVGERFNFLVDNLNVNDAAFSVLSVSSIKFDLYNNSAYSYWDMIFIVELLDENNVVGYGFLSVPEFMSNQKKTIDLRHFGENVRVSNIRVIPNINIFDSNIYIEPKGTK